MNASKQAQIQVSTGMNSFIAGIEKFLGLILGRRVPVRPGPMACTDGETIFLPPQEETEEGKLIYLGKALHEVSHLYCKSDFAHFKAVQLEKHGQLKARLINITDDIRVEYDLQKEYPRVVGTTQPYWLWKEKTVLPEIEGPTSIQWDLVTLIGNIAVLFIARCRFQQIGITFTYKPGDLVERVYDEYFRDLEPEALKQVVYQDSVKLAMKLYDRIKDLLKDDLKPPPPKQNQRQESEDRDDNNDDDSDDQPGSGQSGDDDSEPEQSDSGDDDKGSDDSGEDKPDSGTGTGDEDDNRDESQDSKGGKSGDDSSDSQEESEDSDQPSSGQGDDSEKGASAKSKGEDSAGSDDSGDDQGDTPSKGDEEDEGEAGEDEELNEEVDNLIAGLNNKADQIKTTDDLITDKLNKSVDKRDFEYVKDPSVVDIVGPGVEGQTYYAEVTKQAGIKLLGTSGREMIRHFISNTRPRIIRRQDAGRFDTTTFLKDRYRSDIYNSKLRGVLDKAALAIAVDNSASMTSYGRSLTAANLLSGLLYHTDKNGIPTLAAGYTFPCTTTAYVSPTARRYPVRIDVIKTYEERYDAKVMRRCCPISDSLRGGTPDLDCLQWITPQLMARPEDKKVLFVICDGEPTTANDELTRRLRASYKKYIEACKLAGIKIFGFGIQADLSEYYGEDWAYVSERSLASTFIERLRIILNS
jgi:hypothetical protein